MENEEYERNIISLDEVLEFIDTLDSELSTKISAAIESLGTGETEGLLIKPLRGKIMELSVKQYRIVFCTIESTIYVIDIFKKQSQKTPLRIIERAEKVYNKITNLNL